MRLERFREFLVCPSTRKPLNIVDLRQPGNGDLHHDGWHPRWRDENLAAPPIGLTKRVLLVADGEHAYPVIGEFPVLLAPERLVKADKVDEEDKVDLRDPRYAEAYDEMLHYNSVGEERLGEAAIQAIGSIMGALATHPDPQSIGASFPQPWEIWLDARHDSLSQLEAYQYLSPIAGKVFLQLGGSGSHAVKALIAGAEKAFLLTPMLWEARFAHRLAQHFQVADRLACVLGVGEELPFARNSVDLVYSGGCLHHMRLDYVAAGLHRILCPGGKFAAVDPWKTPLHTIGTKLIGKRETSVFCRPITLERLKPMELRFQDLLLRRHGPILRYLFLGLEKAHLRLPVRWMVRIARADDRFGRLVGLKDRYGGSLVMAGMK